VPGGEQLKTTQRWEHRKSRANNSSSLPRKSKLCARNKQHRPQWSWSHFCQCTRQLYNYPRCLGVSRALPYIYNTIEKNPTHLTQKRKKCGRRAPWAKPYNNYANRAVQQNVTALGRGSQLWPRALSNAHTQSETESLLASCDLCEMRLRGFDCARLHVARWNWLGQCCERFAAFIGIWREPHYMYIIREMLRNSYFLQTLKCGFWPMGTTER
jgi:hypothetical protein